VRPVKLGIFLNVQHLPGDGPARRLGDTVAFAA